MKKLTSIYPGHWAEDALMRELDIGMAVQRTSRTVHLLQTHEQALEAASDARYYASDARYMDPPMPALGRSAKRAAQVAKIAAAVLIM